MDQLDERGPGALEGAGIKEMDPEILTPGRSCIRGNQSRVAEFNTLLIRSRKDRHGIRNPDLDVRLKTPQDRTGWGRAGKRAQSRRS